MKRHSILREFIPSTVSKLYSRHTNSVQGGAEGVRDRMGKAANRDVEESEQSRRFMSRYFKRMKTEYAWSRVVNFHLMTSITDPRPTIVPRGYQLGDTTFISDCSARGDH